MRSIERRFNNQKHKTCDLGDFVNLVRAVRYQKYTKRSITTYFLKVINIDDYSVNDKKDLILILQNASNEVEDCTKLGSQLPTEGVNSQGR